MKRNAARACLVLLVWVVSVLALPFVSFGQTGSLNIVSTYTIEGGIFEVHDIVAFSATSNSYRLAASSDGKEIFGVIESNPVVVFRTTDTAKVPVAQTGELLVNVSDINGPIAIGDRVTVSAIPGKGQRHEGTDGYAVGIALESFPSEVASTTQVAINGDTVTVGSILVLLSIGPVLERDGETVIAPPSVIINDPIDDNERGIPAGVIFRYLLATLFAGVALYLVFRNFGPNLREGLISVGRNPLAKPTIQSMVTFNMLLILTISIAALLVSLVIILIPI